MLKLKLQYFGHLIQRADCWERLRAGGEGDRGWDGWIASLTRWTWVLDRLQELLMDREAWHAVVHGSQRVRHDWATELNWTELLCLISLNILIADFSEVVFCCPHCWYLFCVPFSFLFSFLLLCYRLFSNIWFFLWRRLEYTTQKYALWHKNYFEQKAIENLKTEEKSSIFSFLAEGRM